MLRLQCYCPFREMLDPDLCLTCPRGMVPPHFSGFMSSYPSNFYHSGYTSFPLLKSVNKGLKLVFSQLERQLMANSLHAYQMFALSSLMGIYNRLSCDQLIYLSAPVYSLLPLAFQIIFDSFYICMPVFLSSLAEGKLPRTWMLYVP